MNNEESLYEILSKRVYDGRGVPQHDHGGLVRWVVYGVEPGDFLQAVLKNDLREAIGRADDINRHSLFAIVSWLYNEAPGGCWGSEEKYNNWIGTGIGNGQ